MAALNDRGALDGLLEHLGIRESFDVRVISQGSPAMVVSIQANRVDAVWVSNHGGRQLDSAPVPIELVEPVARPSSTMTTVFPATLSGERDPR